MSKVLCAAIATLFCASAMQAVEPAPVAKAEVKADAAHATAAKLNTVCPFSGKTVDGKTTIAVTAADKSVITVAVADKAAAEAALKTVKIEDLLLAVKENRKLADKPAPKTEVAK